MFLSSSPDKHVVPNPSSKAICPLEIIIQPNLVQILFLHYQAVSWAECISDLHLSTTYAWGFCAAEAKPLLPCIYMLQLANTSSGFQLCISNGQSIPKMKDPSLLSPSALYSAQELSEASLAAKKSVPNNSADQRAGCHCPFLQIPLYQSQPPSSTPSLLPKLVLRSKQVQRAGLSKK